MNEIIRIDQDGKITARELYEFLEQNWANWSRWAKANIEQNEFYQEGVDWWGFIIVMNGNETKDYRLTIDFAKHLCMLSRSARGKAARDYFIEVERRMKQLPFELPQNYGDALRELAATWEREQKTLALLEAAQPKVEFFDAVANSKSAIPIGHVAKVLGVKGLGQNNLFALLRDKRVLMKDNVPFQEYVDRGYFRVVEQKFTKRDETHIYFKTLVYQRGLDFIRKLIESGRTA